MKPQETSIEQSLLIHLLRAGMSVEQFFYIMKAYALHIAITVLVVCVLSVLMSFFVIQPTYKSYATIYIDYRSIDPTGGNFPPHLEPSYMETQKDMIYGKAVRQEAMRSLGLEINEQSEKGFSKSLEVDTGKESRLVFLNFLDETAEGAADGANAIARAYIAANDKMRATPARVREEKYSAELQELRQNVDNIQARLTEYQQQNSIIDSEERLGIEAQKLNNLSERLVAAEAEARLAQVRAKAVSRDRLKGGSLESQADIFDSQYIDSLKGRLLTLEGQLAELSSVLGPNHPRRIALQADIANARQKLAQEISVKRQALDKAALLASQAADGLKEALEAQRERVLKAKEKGDVVSNFRRELEAADKVYQSALAGYDKVLIESQVQQGNVSVVSWATPPELPSAPNKKLNLIIGFFCGLIFGGLTCLLWELSHRRVRCKQDLVQDLNIEVLGELI